MKNFDFSSEHPLSVTVRSYLTYLKMSKRAKSENTKKRKLKSEADNEDEVESSEPPKKKQKATKEDKDQSSKSEPKWQPMTIIGSSNPKMVGKCENPFMIRGKGIYDGVESIDEIIDRLKYQIESPWQIQHFTTSIISYSDQE